MPLTTSTSPAATTTPPAPRALGVVPPANPGANCTPAGVAPYTQAGAVALIDYCRARQGVGPLRLPSNFERLTVPEQMLVLVDLERVNRGEAPIVGLTASLDRLAQQGADAGTDPAIGFGDIWAGGATSTAEALYGWMYDDGYASANLDCVAPGYPACWGHRDIILADEVPAPLVAGAGFATVGPYGSSYAFGLTGYVPGSALAFSWAGELRYFAVPPGIEPLAPGHDN